MASYGKCVERDGKTFFVDVTETRFRQSVSVRRSNLGVRQRDDNKVTKTEWKLIRREPTPLDKLVEEVVSERVQKYRDKQRTKNELSNKVERGINSSDTSGNGMVYGWDDGTFTIQTDTQKLLIADEDAAKMALAIITHDFDE